MHIINQMVDFTPIFFLILISISISTISTEATNILCPIQSLYQFGDSYSDTGNAIRILPVGPTLPVARLPYGQTFPGRPTGRWCDGKLIIDYTATALGLPLLNPNLEQNASFSNGVNYAVGGATALDSSFFTSKGIMLLIFDTLFAQLSSFFTYLNSICSTPTGCGESLRGALFWVEIGANDIYYPLTQGKSVDEVRTYVPIINQAIIKGIRELIGAGATRFVVSGIFPAGCFPIIIAALASNNSTAYDEYGCIRSANNLAVFQNNNLKAALASLRTEFPSVSIVYADFYDAFLTIFRLPTLFGFDRTTLVTPCCGSFGSRPGTCGSPGVPVCPNPQRYIHWDGTHLTQQAYRYISSFIIPNILSNFECL